jgi:predicted Zn-dependent peptidase
MNIDTDTDTVSKRLRCKISNIGEMFNLISDIMSDSAAMHNTKKFEFIC